MPKQAQPISPEESEQTLSSEAQQQLTQFAQYLYQSSGLDTVTARGYLRTAAELAEWYEQSAEKTFSADTITRSNLTQYLDHLQIVRKLKHSTVQVKMTGLRTYFGWLCDEGAIQKRDNPTKGLRVGKRSKRKAVYDQRVTVRITTKMWNHLRTLAGDEREIPGVVRLAIRNLLDEEEDVMGSKRSHARGLRTEMDKLGWYMTLLLILVARIGYHILIRLAPDEDHEQFQPAMLLSDARQSTINTGLDFQTLIGTKLIDVVRLKQLRLDVKEATRKKRGR